MLDFLKQLYLNYSEFTQSNQFLGAAFAASVVGTLGYLLKNIPKAIWEFTCDRLVVTLELEYDSNWYNREVYVGVLSFLHKNSMNFFSRTLSVSKSETESFDDSNTHITSGTGIHLCKIDNKFFWYSVSKENLGGSSNVTKSSLRVKCFSLTQKPLTGLVDKVFNNKENSKLKVYSFNSSWNKVEITPRNMDTVFTNGNTKENIHNQIKTFLDSKAKYTNHGINYKLSYMLHGQPGCGKTSLVKALASEFKFKLYTINLSQMNDTSLENALLDVPENSILLLEDVDCTGNSFSDRKPTNNTSNLQESAVESAFGTTLSGVLNVLDGIKTPDGIIIFMTTNCLDKIDSAILRKGRTDHTVELVSLDSESIKDYTFKLYGKTFDVPENINIKGCDLQSLMFEFPEFEDFKQNILLRQKENRMKISLSSKKITFRNKMQRGSYEITAGPGNMDFTPDLSPKEMLKLGVFEGLYLNSCEDEYPKSWFTSAKLSKTADPTINLFGVKSRQSLQIWIANGWILSDARGWFEWYCRYYQGRRIEEDKKQIGRYNSFARHSGQVKLHGNKDKTLRLKQRQALLQWARDPFPDFQTKSGESVYEKIIRIMK